MYKKVVVGVAILSSPQEAYITYLAVKVGWDNSRIARWASRSSVVGDLLICGPRTMLYHLIAMNPGKDITLHVSTNNTAMVSCRSLTRWI